MNTRLRTPLVSLAAGLALVVAACGDDSDTADTADTAAPPAASTPASSTPASSTPASPSGGDDGYGMPSSGDTAPAGTIEVTETSLGEVLTSGGMTLYIFTPDDGGDPTCYDDCAVAWPPLKAGATAGQGIDDSKLGTAARTDGGEQITYNGWPLYFYAADTSPGDVNGQGVGGVWFVIDADGNPIEA